MGISGSSDLSGVSVPGAAQGMWEIGEELDLNEERGIVGLLETCAGGVLLTGALTGGIGAYARHTLRGALKFSGVGIAVDCITSAE